MRKSIVPTLIAITIFALGQSASTAGKKESVTFLSSDGIVITADVYMTAGDKKRPFIVLFHQAGWSRGEYLEIAPRLNALGFNCMAVDLRSGDGVNSVQNETAKRASKKGKGQSYVDAMPDIEAALKYARSHYADGKIIAWGSSYSAALALKVAGDRPELVDGVLSFSPGEYFGRSGKPATWIQDAAGKIKVPVFITSARGEKGSWSGIFGAIRSEKKTFYLPDTIGNHGSRALWAQFKDSAGYWKAVESFLLKNFIK